MTRKSFQGIPATELRSPDGATVMVADHGAHVLSWVPADGEEALFLSAHSRYGAGDAIRGGVPVIFPQFGERGSGKRHGFARNAEWRLEFSGLDNGKAVARLGLTHDDIPSGLWPHRFRLTFEVAVHAQQLQMSLTVLNSSDAPWDFSAALHTYLRVSDIAGVALSGLQDVAYIDQAQAGAHAVQREPDLRFTGEVDRIYPDAPKLVSVHERNRILTAQQEGFRDAVVWNPGYEKAAALTDLTPGSQVEFLCVEAAAVVQALALAPGAQWQGSQTIISKKTT